MNKRQFCKLLGILLTVALIFGQIPSFTVFAEETSTYGQVLYEDDFEAGASNWTATYGNWSIVDAAGSSQYEKDKTYVPTIGFSVLNDPASVNWTDYSVSADMTVLEMLSGGRAELSARFSTNTIRYAFVMTSSSLQIKKRNTGDHVLVNKAHAIVIGKKYHVTGVLIGNKLEMWVDGEKVLEVVDENLKNEPTIPSGKIALSNYNASVQYDNVKVINMTGQPPEEPEKPVTDIVLSDLVIAGDEGLENIIASTLAEGVYSANVPFAVTQAYLLPVVNSNDIYSLLLDGVEIVSGNVAGPVVLNTGLNVFKIAIEEDGKTTREYIVEVTRANAVDISVDTSNVLVKREGNNPVGLCLSWITDSDKNERTYTMEEVIKNSNFGTIRWPMGTLAMQYVWNSADENGDFQYPIEPRFILPDTLRNNFSFAATEEPGVVNNEMDFDEYLKLVKNTGATAVIDVNVGGDLYQGATVNGAALTYEQLKALAAEQVRYAKEKGFTGLYWEVGNEVEFLFDAAKMPGVPEAERVQEYIRRYREFYDVMKAEDPTAKIGVGLNLAAQKNNWQLPVMQGCKDKMEFVVTHQYGGHNFTGAGISKTYDGYMNNDYSKASHAIQKINLISSYMDELGNDESGKPYADRLEILVTEYSSHCSAPGWFDCTGGVIYLALHNFEILAEMMNHPKVGPTHFWITRSPWSSSGLNALINYDASVNDNNALLWDGSLTAMGMSVAIMSANMYDSMVNTQTGNFRVRPYASYNEDTKSLTVFLLNRENNYVETNITLDNYDGLEFARNARVFEGKNGSYLDTEYKYEETGAIEMQGNEFSINLPPASITVVTFTSPLPEITDITIDDLNGVLDYGYLNNLITNHGILNSLKVKVDGVIKDRDNSKNVINGLNALGNHMEAQAGSNIDGEFASLLLKYLRYLESVYKVIM